MQTLEAELAASVGPDHEVWPPSTFYTAYYVMGGCVLGMIGAATSLLFNVIGSLVFGKPALLLIQVYLTFPLGERAGNG